MTVTAPAAGTEYPGRLIALGTTPDGRYAVVYAVTGRSPSSQARLIVAREDGLYVEPSDEAVLRTGNPDLLVYPAMLFTPAGTAVSNGKQTASIAAAIAAGRAPREILAEALASWDYEPDAPIYTPRISGCVNDRGAALSIVKRAPDGASARELFDVPSRRGWFSLVSTYDGPNRDPLPIFSGGPREVPVISADAATVASAFYEALGPSADGAPDFRVAVACVVEGAGGACPAVAVINRRERT